MKEPKLPNGYKFLREGIMPSGKGPVMKVCDGSEWSDSDGSLGGRPVSILAPHWRVAVPADKPTAKWAPIPATTRLTKAALIETANKLGAENAKLKSKLAKGGEG